MGSNDAELFAVFPTSTPPPVELAADRADISEDYLLSLIDDDTVEAVQLGLSVIGNGLVTVNIPSELVPLLALTDVDGGRLLDFLLGNKQTSNIFQKLPEECDPKECYVGDSTRYVRCWQLHTHWQSPRHSIVLRCNFHHDVLQIPDRNVTKVQGVCTKEPKRGKARCLQALASAQGCHPQQSLRTRRDLTV